MLEPMEESRCVDISRLLGCLCDEHEIILAVDEVPSIRLDRPADCQFMVMAAHVSGDIGKARASITVEGLVPAAKNSSVLTAKSRTV